MAFPEDETDLRVSVAFGANLATSLPSLSYTPITDYVKPRVVISRGRIGDSAIATPADIKFGLRNPDGIFSPRNISSPYFGNLRQNTPVKVELDPGSGMVTRGIAYIPSWPVRWTGPDIDDRIEIAAAGPGQRIGLGRGSMSALHRTVLATNPVAYWRMEDNAGAAFGAPTAGAAGMMPQAGTVVWADQTDLVGATQAPTTSDATLIGAVSGGSSTSWHVEFVAKGSFTSIAIARVYTDSPTANTYRVTWPSSSAGTMTVFVTAPDGTLLGGASTGTAAGDDWEDNWHHIGITAEQSGSDISVTLTVDGVAQSEPISSVTTGAVTEVWLNHNRTTEMESFAHVAVGDGTTLSDAADGIDGFDGENAGDRFARLCAEEGIDSDVAGTTGQAMGQQLPGEITDLLRECEDTSQGLMIERRTGELGLDLPSLWHNAAVALTMDYEIHLADLQPDNDDRDTVNYAQVNRVGGQSAVAERTTGPKGSSKVTGVGKYPADPDRSLASDDQTANHAGWVTGLGTVDEDRIYAVLRLNENTDLIAQWLACDVGSRVQITNPPAIQTGPATLDLMLDGYVETLDGVDWIVEMWLMPYLPYQAVEIESGPENTSRIPASGSVTDAEYGPAATSLSVTSPSTDTRWIDSAAYSSKFPIDIIIAGERMSCTAIVGTGATQTFTVARGSDGITKTLPSGSEVQIYHPARLPL